MAFHFQSEDEARAALYDAALLLLDADAAIGLPFTIGTITTLSNLCRCIADGQKISRSPLLSL